MRVLRSSVAAALAVLVSMSSAALAAPTARERAEARTLATEGRKALRDKRWADAIVALKKADKLDPAPGLAIDLAAAQIGAGKLVEAGRTLGTVNAGSDGTPAARRTREAARKMLADVKRRTPTVTVTVTGAPAGKTSTLVNGVEVDGSGPVAVNPGDHTVGAAAPGFFAAEQEVGFAEGASKEVTLDLKPKAPPVAAEKRGSRAPGAVVTAIGGAGLVVGGVFGGLAFTATNTAKSKCTGTVCPQVAADDVARSKLYGNVSTGAFIAGGAVAVTGIALLIAAPGGSKGDESPKGARVSPSIGPGVAGLGATGSF